MAFKLDLKALKNIDWKELLLQQGDKITLITAGSIGFLLLVCGLLWPDSGIWLIGKPGSNITALTTDAKDLEDKLNTVEPQAKHKPKEATPKLPQLSSYAVKDPSKYFVSDFITYKTQTDTSRRQPTVLAPVEGTAAVVMDQIKTYEFNESRDKVFILQGAGQGNASAQQDLQNMRAYGNSRRPMGRLPNQPQFQRGRQAGPAPEDRKTYTKVPVSLAELADPKEAMRFEKDKLAVSPQPLLQAIIVGSFPFKDQLEEFRSKLRLPSFKSVLDERLDIKDMNVALPGFRFVGVNLERRVVDAQGHPLDAKGKPLQDKNGGWETIDLRKDYRNYLALTASQTQPDDEEILPIRFNGLVMPRLIMARSGDVYPHLETGRDKDKPLPKIAQTLDQLAQAKTDPKQKLGVPSGFNTESFDIFGQGGAGQANPGQNPNNPRPGFPMSKLPGGSVGMGQVQNQDVTPPTHCLIRVIDVTIKPGHIYEYRMQVEMANPNYGRSDPGMVANPAYAQGEKLEPSKWFVIPTRVVVPPVKAYYAVDQKEIETREIRKAVPFRFDYKPELKVPFQIHYWLEKLEGKGTYVGEWVVADRVLVSRGEPIGRPVRIEFPIWHDLIDGFMIPQSQVGGKGRNGPARRSTSPIARRRPSWSISRAPSTNTSAVTRSSRRTPRPRC